MKRVARCRRLPATRRLASRQMPAMEQDFARGWPHPSMLSLPSLKKSLAGSFNSMLDHSEDFLQYGKPNRSYMFGQAQFLETLADFLASEYCAEVSSDTLMSTCGCSSGIDQAARSFTTPGDIAVAEAPTYYLAHRILEDSGLKLKEVPMQEDGLDLEALRRVCEEHRGQVKLVYTIPIHHNPTGVTLSASKRKALVNMAQEFDFMIVADEAYQLLSFEPTEVLPLFYSDDPANPRVVSVGSFSKLIGPGLKVGWIQAHPAVLNGLFAKAGWIKSGSNPVIFTSGILIEFMRSGDLSAHIRSISSKLARKCSVLVEELEAIGLEPNHPQGGYFVWLRPKGKKRTGRSGDGMALDPPDAFADHMRLSFAWLTEGQLWLRLRSGRQEQIVEGVRFLTE